MQIAASGPCKHVDVLGLILATAVVWLPVLLKVHKLLAHVACYGSAASSFYVLFVKKKI